MNLTNTHSIQDSQAALSFLQSYITTPDKYNEAPATTDRRNLAWVNSMNKDYTPLGIDASNGKVFANKLKQIGAFTQLTQRKVEIAGGVKRGDVQATLNAMRNISGFKELLGGSPIFACRSEENPKTVGDHTQSVIERFKSQRQFFGLEAVADAIKSRGVRGFENFDANFFMATLLAAHDIGKSLGNSSKDQHIFTNSILKKTMKALGFTPKEVKLAVLLVGNDILGDLQRNKIVTNEARNQLQGRANAAGIPLDAFYKLQKALYISDASSYQYIVGKYMKTLSDGQLCFNKDGLEGLENLVSATTAGNP